jgi:Tfp pilus assembly protein PilN
MIRVNLIPEEILVAQLVRARVQRWTVAIIAALAVLAIPFGLDFHHQQQVKELRAQHAELEQNLTSVRSDVRDVIAEQRKVHGQIERAKALRTKRGWSGLVTLLADCLPNEVWLSNLSTDPPSPRGGQKKNRSGGSVLSRLRKGKEKLTAAPEGNTTITIDAPRALVFHGFAADNENLWQFIAQLKATDVFDEVTLVNSGVEPVLAGIAVAFELRCTW